MCKYLPASAPLVQHLNRTTKTLLALLLNGTEQQTFLTRHCMLVMPHEPKLRSFIAPAHIYTIYEQLYQHCFQLQYDFSNILEVLDLAVKHHLLTHIPSKTNLVAMFQQSIAWKLLEEALFMDLFKLALPRFTDPKFCDQVLDILGSDTTIPDEFDLVLVDNHITTDQPLEPYYRDVRILLTCTAIFLGRYPELRNRLQHSRSYTQDSELLWKDHTPNYTEAILPSKLSIEE